MIGNLKRLARAGLAGAIAVMVCFGTSSFAASFKKDWKAAMKTGIPTNSFLGPWEGVWKSEGHHVSGPLRCIIKDTGNGNYEAFFHAQFHWFHFSYSAKMLAEKSEKGMILKGDANLGVLGGHYHYSGETSGDKYVSSYRSPVEYGRLELSRPKPLANELCPTGGGAAEGE